ncbi:MAG: alpha/beta hydrolase-fold protein, partial [Saprospiraceae bacterium]|nr:alpha/beta hydrolase-fold protein [Saprospiraceae bacterium]
ERFRMKKDTGKSYEFFLDVMPVHLPLEYSYLKGGWDDEELDIYGNRVAKRTITALDELIVDRVVRWRKNGKACDPALLPEKYIIEKDFEIPQLKKRRRIWALLPHDYHQQSTKRYPVLYLQDAQNLFNEHAPFGNWAIDEKIAVLSEQGFGDFIVVAIEHGGRDRIKEFSPFKTEKFGAGEGKLYARFLIETLKPYVDKKFRTESGRLHTAIGGSSMGGLISVFAGMMYPDIFSKWMIFSPSLWVSSKIFTEANEFTNTDPTFVYLYGGKSESRSMERDLNLFVDILTGKSDHKDLIRYKLSIHPTALHNEQYWGQEFPKAAKWLFFN